MLSFLSSAMSVSSRLRRMDWCLSSRVTFQAFLENARVPMQIDIGFGDTVVPEAKFAD
jgi:hypothetical protein